MNVKATVWNHNIILFIPQISLPGIALVLMPCSQASRQTGNNIQELKQWQILKEIGYFILLKYLLLCNC